MNALNLNIKFLKGRFNSRSGFSIPEVFVTCLIFAFLAAAINATIFTGNSSWQVNSVEVELQQDLRQAMGRMRNDLLQTGSASLDASIPINAAPDPVTYPDPDDDPAYDFTPITTISFQLVTGTVSGLKAWESDTTQFALNGTNLEKTVGTNPAVIIAENIASMSVRRLFSSSNIVEIALEAQKDTLTGQQGRTISSTLNFHVQLRN